MQKQSSDYLAAELRRLDAGISIAVKDIAARTRSALATTPWLRKAKPAGAMGQMCSQPMGDDGHDIAIVSGQSRSTDATELSSGKTQRKNLTSVGRQTSGLVDNDSGPRVHKAAGAPAFGKRASTQWMAKEGSASLVEERMTPLKECTDEMIIAEVKLRNIKLHDRITKELVASKYTYGKILGQGSSASVYEAVHTKSKKKVAIKVIKRNDDINDDESMATELEILRTVRHRYILNCHELYESPQCIWVVMELIKGGELLDVLVERGLYSEADASRAMKQVLLAVRYLHSQGIVHRDLKLQNILLVSKEKDSDTKIGAQFRAILRNLAQFCAVLRNSAQCLTCALLSPQATSASQRSCRRTRTSPPTARRRKRTTSSPTAGARRSTSRLR